MNWLKAHESSMYMGISILVYAVLCDMLGYIFAVYHQGWGLDAVLAWVVAVCMIMVGTVVPGLLFYLRLRRTKVPHEDNWE